jgi:hypothetical protein
MYPPPSFQSLFEYQPYNSEVGIILVIREPERAKITATYESVNQISK